MKEQINVGGFIEIMDPYPCVGIITNISDDSVTVAYHDTVETYSIEHLEKYAIGYSDTEDGFLFSI